MVVWAIALLATSQYRRALACLRVLVDELLKCRGVVVTPKVVRESGHAHGRGGQAEEIGWEHDCLEQDVEKQFV